MNNIELIKTRKDLTQKRLNIPFNATVGFTPTMGNLHAGHLSLIESSLRENEFNFVSIFVNPKQFGPQEDFVHYPRTLKEDLKKLENLAGRFDKPVAVFAPQSEEEIFPDNYCTEVAVKNLNAILEGRDRPTHFDGVTTVVYQLLTLVRPHVAYFGKKDFQQYIIIKQMVRDLLLPTKIRGMEIIRSPEGLALSSRNHYLSDNGKQEALLLRQTLLQAKEFIQSMFLKNSKLDLKEIHRMLQELSDDIQWHYLEAKNSNNLNDIEESSLKIVILGAINVEDTRLLDNIEISLEGF
ncbi:MAG: pantoate--beta-alanine ligase [Halobacteriovoraceae bacterium]|nr:pantoate--beta-alanine ligase [Halobacteriovoraceae bacterium]MCB9095652.1 pantoate--beta-alanine ligase [Halobacteriovoraceae bacterium]